jgi:hypothetical protein
MGGLSGAEWFILIVVVILIPLAIAVAVTLWTLEMARQRNKRNRGDRAVGVKRRATRPTPSSDMLTEREAQGESASDTSERR